MATKSHTDKNRLKALIKYKAPGLLDKLKTTGVVSFFLPFLFRLLEFLGLFGFSNVGVNKIRKR